MRHFFIIFLILISTAQCFAQDRKLQLSVITTPQLSWLNSDNTYAERQGVRLGYSVGLQGDYFFAPHYAISTSILYSKYGGNLAYATPFTMEVGSVLTPVEPGDVVLYNLSYIELPIGLKLKTNEFWRSTYWVQLGISPMINTASVDKDKNDLSKETSLFNLGYHFGIGMDYSMGGSTYLTTAVMLTNGLTDITTNTLKDKATLRSVNLRIGVIF